MDSGPSGDNVSMHTMAMLRQIKAQMTEGDVEGKISQFIRKRSDAEYPFAVQNHQPVLSHRLSRTIRNLLVLALLRTSSIV